MCCCCRRGEGNKELVMWRVFVVYCCCLLIKGSPWGFMLPLELIWWLEEEDISVCFEWSFPGEWSGRGAILITVYLFQGLARGSRDLSRGSFNEKEGASHLQRTCLTDLAFGSNFPWCPSAVKMMTTCLSIMRCLRFPCPEEVLKELSLSVCDFLSGWLCCHCF